MTAIIPQIFPIAAVAALASMASTYRACLPSIRALAASMEQL